LTGEQNLRTCAARILEWGPRYVVIKKGEHGAMLISRAGTALIPAYPVDKVVDPTGAGDAFAGAFMGALAAGGTTTDAAVRSALVCGSVVASFAVQEFSLDRLARLKKAEIARRRRELLKMIRFG
jgi:sugar/nucleoside kinase (ribokinase family)